MKRKNIAKIAGCSALAMAFVLGAAACGGSFKIQYNNPERRPLYMSISQPDEVFNPFFSTSAYDGTIVSMTQIGMLATDKDGGILPRVEKDASGNITKVLDAENEPCVVKYWDSTFDATESTGERGHENEGVTTYQFALKNGIKFSDGKPLTINDVLFNLYAYLDPAYTGSSTIYSTHILGLNAYRTQNPDATDASAGALDEEAEQGANERIDDLIDYVHLYGATSDMNKPSDRWNADEKERIKDDFEYVAAQFLQEVESYWGGAADSMESYKDWERYDSAAGKYIKWQEYRKKYNSDDAWIIFLMDYGFVTSLIYKNPDSTEYKWDDLGNRRIDKDEEAKYRKELEEYCEEYELDSKTVEAQRQFAIDYVYGTYFRRDLLTGKPTVELCMYDKLEQVLSWWSTAQTVASRFMAEYKRAKFAGSLEVPNISGITTFKASAINGHPLGEECDILQIKIRKIDPKAIWNFAFTVAPMHYYSGTYKGKNYVEAFDIEKNEFGVEWSDFSFFQDVMNSPSKVGLPVGAGPYMASSASGNPATSGKQFFNNNIVYFQRNPYFETVGEKLENAKIKYLYYRVVASDQIISSLKTGAVDIGDPNATPDNTKELKKDKNIDYAEAKTAGYGYVGINPRYVPDINVRRAIMKAMNTNLITNNYYENLADKIYRPMSKVSWAYPSDKGVFISSGAYGVAVSYAYDSTGNDIKKLLTDAGYTPTGYRNVKGQQQPTGWKDRYGDEVSFDYKFTIAGGSTDHPAYNMFLTAQEILNRIGFKIKVVVSQTALSDLTTGKLTVWAAAWSSTIDPDMYQVYHKDSKASSVNNWGYPQILKDKTLYANENSIITALSTLIDQGRETDKREERKPIYSQALDLVMELAVEFPTYQRYDVTAYRQNIIDPSTLTPKNEVDAYNGLTSRVWEINYYLQPETDK